mgnify:FL=1
MKRRGPRRAKVDRIGKMMRDPERGAEFRRRRCGRVATMEDLDDCEE